MEIKNTLTKPAKNNTGVTTYEVNGVQVTLTFETVEKYLVSGGGNVSRQEVLLYIAMCKANNLNPFDKDCYLIKYGNTSPAAMVTAEKVFLKRAQKHPDFDGLQAGIIVMNPQTGQITEREGTFYMVDKEQLVGGWCKVYTKGRKIPSYEAVSLSEYIGKKKDGTINEQWTKRPATMIRKVARVHALREAFPTDLGGLYAQEEIETAQDIVLDESPIEITEPQAQPWQEQDFTQQREFPPQGQSYEQAAFFPQQAAGGVPTAPEAAPGGPVNDPASVLFS